MLTTNLAWLIQHPAFTPAPDDLFGEAVSECLEILCARFPRYREFLESRHFNGTLGTLPAIFLPVLKTCPFAVPSDVGIVRTLTSSGTTGKPSATPLDAGSWY